MREYCRATRDEMVSGNGLATADYPPPPAAPSYYISNTNINSFYDLGHELGVHDRDTPGKQDNLVILDYGYPALSNGIYGAKLSFQPTIFISSTDVRVQYINLPEDIIWVLDQTMIRIPVW